MVKKTRKINPYLTPHIQPLRGWSRYSAIPQVSPGAIQRGPLSGLEFLEKLLELANEELQVDIKKNYSSRPFNGSDQIEEQ